MIILLVFILLSSQAAPVLASGAERTVSIRTVEDLAELSDKCSLDSWSSGKTVLLEADLDLRGRHFQPIRIFSGVFDGQGHTISGLSIAGSGNVRGLFRYVQADGTIRNLHVEGSVLPAGRKDTMGGIVGSNSGKLMNCTFQGVVRGAGMIGGVVGVNEASGQLINCSFGGTVSGEHYVGGIAGQNAGSLIQCENGGSINTTEVEVKVRLQDVDWKQLNSAENAPASTDIGGITGYSTGVLQSCTNTGDVGYEHVSYNVGGIAGRQSGYLDGCTNSGTIRGRKDVAGIAGQMEPKLTLKYNQGTLGNLWDELDTLQALMDRSLDDAGVSSDHISAQMERLTDSTRTVKGAVSDLSDALTDWGNGNIDQINDFSARISWLLNQMDPILDSMELVFDGMGDAADSLSDAMDEARSAGALWADAADNMGLAIRNLEDAVNRGEDALKSINSAVNHLRLALGDSAETSAALGELHDGLTDLNGALSIMGGAIGIVAGVLQQNPDLEHLPPETAAVLGEQVNIILVQLQIADEALQHVNDAVGCLTENLDPEEFDAALEDLSNALGALQKASQSLAQATDHASHALEDISAASPYVSKMLDCFSKTGDRMASAFNRLSQATGDTQKVIDELAEKPAIQFEKINSTITRRGDALDDSLSGLLDGVDGLNGAMSAASDALIADMKAVNQQIGVIIDLIQDAVEETGDKKIGDTFEDISDQEDAGGEDAGHVSGSWNTGTVEGDVNTAGIVGSLAIEYDFDPEDDLTEVGDRSLDFRYQARAVVSGCGNTGSITGKKDFTGGIVGRMDLGSVAACEGYGTITSTDGDYVGGVAGASYGTIRESWARCALSGGDYIGGIAGYGGTIIDSHSLIEIKEGTAYLGAIAGDMDDDGVLTGNTFVQKTLGGWDDISYTGKAEPVSFDALSVMARVPAAFTQFQLTFMADDKIVAVVPFQYGDSLDSLPEIPAKKGYSARWPSMDYSRLTFSQTLKAEYTPYLSALTDETAPPQILVDGSFSRDADITHTASDVTWTDSKGTPYSGTAYTVTISDPVLKDVSYTVHYRLPDRSKRYTLWVQTTNGWEQQDYQIDGSYLMLNSQNDQITFCVYEQSPLLSTATLAVMMILLAMVMIGMLMFIKKQHGKRHQPKEKKTPTNSF